MNEEKEYLDEEGLKEALSCVLEDLLQKMTKEEADELYIKLTGGFATGNLGVKRVDELEDETDTTSIFLDPKYEQLRKRVTRDKDGSSTTSTTKWDLPNKAKGTLALVENIPTMLSDFEDDAEHRLVTDSDKNKWNKADESLADLGRHKNLIKTTPTNTSSNGVTLTDNGDGTYLISGTNTSGANAIFSLTIENIGVGQGKLVGVPATDLGIIQQTQYDGSWGASAYWDRGAGAILPDMTKLQKIAILVSPGKTVDHIVKPMLTYDLEATYEDYEPFTGTHRTVISDVAELVKKAYIKPDGGIPKTDLASAVQTSLGLADTALQEHQDLSNYSKTLNLIALTQSIYDGKDICEPLYNAIDQQLDVGDCSCLVTLAGTYFVFQGYKTKQNLTGTLQWIGSGNSVYSIYFNNNSSPKYPYFSKLYGHSSVMPTGMDLNTMIYSGTYYLAVANSYTNLPEGSVKGFLNVIETGSTIKQMVYQTNGTQATTYPYIYIRQSVDTGATWTSWTRLATMRDIPTIPSIPADQSIKGGTTYISSKKTSTGTTSLGSVPVTANRPCMIIFHGTIGLESTGSSAGGGQATIEAGGTSVATQSASGSATSAFKRVSAIITPTSSTLTVNLKWSGSGTRAYVNAGAYFDVIQC